MRPSADFTSRPVTERLMPALLAQHCGGCGRLRCGPCPLCRSLLAGLPQGRAPDGVTAVRSYQGVVRDLITAMKYQRHPNTVALLAEVLDDVHDRFADVDVITWAPTSARRRQRRGFDQAELLARAVARRWRLPVRDFLRRDDSQSQTGRSRAERLAGPQFGSRTVCRWRHVLVLDDVVTTGTTLRHAVAALRAAGAPDVSAVAVAAAP